MLTPNRWIGRGSALAELGELHKRWQEATGEKMVSLDLMIESALAIGRREGGLENWRQTGGDYGSALADFVEQFPT